MSFTLSLDKTPAGLSANLISLVYGQYIQNFQINQSDKLSLSTPAGENLTGLSELASALFEAAGKSNDALGSSAEDKAQVQNWLNRIGSGEFEGQDKLKALDAELSTKTYLVGSSPTAADLALFAALHSHLSQASHSAHLSHPSVSRHFDQIQHLPLVATAIARAASTPFTPVGIDANNVPLVEIKQEVKVKKAKAGESEAAPAPAAAAAGAEAPKAEGEAKPAKEAKAKKEAKVEGAAAGGAVEGGKKKEKAPKEKKAPAPAPVNEAPAPWMVDLRVGKIVGVKLHPEADSLYVEEIDVGEAEPRTVISGLVKYIPIDQMLGKTLITVCNLKPANMRGIKSFAMVLCASGKEGKDSGVEFVDPPAGSVPGDRVFFEGFENQTALELLNPKKKIFETVQPGFTTTEAKEACWVSPEGKVHRIVTSKGLCTVPTHVGGSLS